MPAELNRKKTSLSKVAKRKSTSANVAEKSAAAENFFDMVNADVDTLPESIQYLGGKHRAGRQRAKYHQQFTELTAVIGASDPFLCALTTAEASGTNTAARTITTASVTAGLFSSSSSVPFADAFPTLSVGYLARAMGLNVSEEQVASIIELVEEDGPSTGFVDRRKLEPVLVEALLTGTIGGATLRKFAVADSASAVEEAKTGKLSLERLEQFMPSLCVRDDEATLYRAFEALDVNKKGYLEYEDLREPMTTEGEQFSAEEADEMWIAMRDPETNRVYYRDFADVLARE